MSTEPALAYHREAKTDKHNTNNTIHQRSDKTTPDVSEAV